MPQRFTRFSMRLRERTWRGVSGCALTWCLAGTGMRSLRPGNALSFVGIVLLCDPHIVVTSVRPIVGVKPPAVNVAAPCIACGKLVS